LFCVLDCACPKSLGGRPIDHPNQLYAEPAITTAPLSSLFCDL
jgi:hypothetical protein